MPTEWKAAFHYRYGKETCGRCVSYVFGDRGGLCMNPKVRRHEGQSNTVILSGVCDLYQEEAK